jgi:hypothetical protein
LMDTCTRRTTCHPVSLKADQPPAANTDSMVLNIPRAPRSLQPREAYFGQACRVPKANLGRKFCGRQGSTHALWVAFVRSACRAKAKRRRQSRHDCIRVCRCPRGSHRAVLQSNADELWLSLQERKLSCEDVNQVYHCDSSPTNSSRSGAGLDRTDF